MIRNLSLAFLSLFFIGAGCNHFRMPAFYEGMMPDYLPWPHELVLISGVAEIAGGLGVLIRGLRRAAGWGLIALLVAVFPAHIQMLQHGLPGMNVPAWALWARLPMQAVLAAWVYYTCLSRTASSRR